MNVQIDALRFTYDYPVINGEFSFALPRALDIHVAQQRAFVKAVAVHTGLGLRLWEKDEDVPLIPDGGLNLQLTIKLGEKVGKYGSPAAVLTGLGTTKAEMDALIKGADIEAKKAMLEKIIAL